MTGEKKPQSTILVVDDTPTNLEVLYELLNARGYEVLVAIDGENALRQAEYAKPDIILLDVMMPGWNGFETCQHLKKNKETRKIPIIFMTALSETMDKVNAFKLGAVDYVTKPLQHEEVLARVKTHVTLSQLQNQLEASNEFLEKRVEERTAQLKQLNTVYEKFVPHAFIQYLNKDSVLDVTLGDQVHHDMTVMFADVQGWTTLSERKSPQDNFAFIIEYFSLVSPIIRQHRGFVDQYYGDGIMALFPDRPNDAVDAAIAIQKKMREYHAMQTNSRDPGIRVGIGLHSGKLMLGIIGEAQRMQAAVVSDNVNLASRLEGLTRIYRVSIIISEQTLARLDEKHAYRYRFVDKVQVKGKQKAVAVYEIYDGDKAEEIELKLKTRDLFEEGLQLYYEKRFTEASVKFNEVYKITAWDQAARIYLERCADYMVNGVPDGWQGITRITEK